MKANREATYIAWIDKAYQVFNEKAGQDPQWLDLAQAFGNVREASRTGDDLPVPE